MGTRSRLMGSAALAGALTLTAGPAMAAGTGSTAYTCTGGAVPSGTYSSLTVTGVCWVASGADITVTGNVQVDRGAVLDAQRAPATVTIGRNVTAAPGSVVGLGCQPPSYTGNSAHTCEEDPEGHSTISVGGNVTATGAQAFLLNGVSVKGNVTFTGGGSDLIPWSVKNNTIGGNLTMSGQRATFVGVLFNHVGRNVTLSDIVITDVDPGPGVYVVRNTVGRNLTCSGLVPGVSGGFVPGSVNVVGGNATGQCAALV